MHNCKLTRWQYIALLNVEGLYLLVRLFLRLAEWVPFWWLLSDGYPADQTLTSPHLAALAAAAGGWLLQGLCLPPLRLGRAMWYSKLAAAPNSIPSPGWLFAGWRHWGAAVGWRWRLWWRRTAAVCIASLPPLLVWQYGARGTGYPLLWLSAGGLLAAVTLLWAFVRQSRYGAAPLLLAEGRSAEEALHLSARIMKKQGLNTLFFWTKRLPELVACLLPPVALWLVPAMRLEHTTRLLQLRRRCPLPDPPATRQSDTCILRPGLL